MAEISINPFGQTDEMPTGINVINRLDSNNTRSALSAAQGMRLKGMIDAIGSNSESGEITRYAVNMCDTAKMVSGTLSNTGELTTGSGLVTDFIPVSISNRKTQYLQVCASVFKSSAFGYRATKVCLYDATKNYIATIGSVTAIIDKESQANASNFESAAYIRVQFDTGTSDHYVALSNKPVLPLYSPYNKADLTATKESLAPKIRNTDAAITNMLETALDYLGQTDALNLGYGDSATAFDEDCIAVTADPWNDKNNPCYSGEKKQINCSTFVQLCLQGIRYENSRYALGTDADNHGNGYVFDDKVETNYHNAREDSSSWSEYAFARFVPCSKHNKIYAQWLLKYALDRGFAYLIEDGFKNVEVGDVVFSSNLSDNFKDVGHTLFVSAVSLNSDGTKVISIMEDGHSGVSESQKTSRPSQYVYAARFPLPHLASRAKNIVSDVSNNFGQSSTSSVYFVGSLTLSENVKKHGVYTAVVKCSAVGNFEVMIGTRSGNSFSPLSTNGQDLFRRGDGVTVKHFHLPVNSVIDTNTLAVAIKAYATLSGEVEIVDAKVYNGYVTE